MRALALVAVVFAGIATFCECALAQAPSASDTIKALAGSWEMSNADHDKICILALKTDTAPGGLRVDFDKTQCLGNFPSLKDATAWVLPNAEDDGVLHLVDAKGKIIFEFTEVESGTYESLKAGQPLTFLQNAAVAAAANANRSADQMTGQWNFVRGDGPPICTLNLSNTPVGNDFALKINPGCDTAITAFAPTTWQLDKQELVLKSARGQTWRFEESDGTWQRVPEGNDPLSLIRQ